MSGGITVIVDNVKQVRQEWVDNLKGIAVMAVVAIHSGGWTSFNTWKNRWNWFERCSAFFDSFCLFNMGFLQPIFT